MAKLRFDGKVVVVTGSGGGLGKAYALEFARRGAYVVVNDLGCSFHGEGKGTQLADTVVNEIKKEGGKAVANYDSVENGENIIATAIEHFGRVDILINNAGILRDRSFMNLSEGEWDAVYNVHSKGAFKVTKAAWPYMKKQKYGRIVMTTSPSGMYGNFGQANYCAAKLSLVGLANALAIEGNRSNIHVNCIAPIAETRMTLDVMGDSGMMKIDYIVPFVVFLCHESCSDNGSIIETAGGFACKVRWDKSEGMQLREYVDDNVTVEKVADYWDQFTQFPQPSTGVMPAPKIMESVQSLPEKSPSEALVEKMRSHKMEEVAFSYTEDDIIQYALGIGATLPSDFQYLYEGHSDFSIIPTFLVSKLVAEGFGMSSLPGIDQLDMSRVLHGEQYIKLFETLPNSGTFTMSPRFVDLLDKGRFCSMILESDIFDEKRRKLATMQTVTIFLGNGGTGRKGKCPDHVLPVAIPNRLPDNTVEEETNVNQAALFRLSGDKNPLHIDPNMSSLMGFKEPILHGLCFYGFATRHVLKTYANNDSSLFVGMKAQFSKPVTPGDTLVTEMWREGLRVIFQTKVKETGNIVLKGGFVDLVSVHETGDKSLQSRL